MRSYAHKSRKRAKRMTEAQYAVHVAKLAGGAVPDAPQKGRGKFGNEKVFHEGMKFDSKRELRRWLVLVQRQQLGLICELRRQVAFELAPRVDLGEKRKKPAMRYVADFVYVDVETGETIVEDAKGFQTPQYRDRKHLMASVHNIIIREV
jgi:hypothetical protein